MGSVSILAMHMANELLSVPVAAATLAGAAVALVISARAARKTELDRLPLMGVMGAFVFAAQMINFTLPGMPGTSGHLGGGVLLAILLRPAAAILTMAAILIVQCLLFQDGGLLALGCNIINMGIVPCLLGWGVYRMAIGTAGPARAWRQYVAAWAACMVGVTGGAMLVPAEARLSGVLQVPVWDFWAVMTGVHILIGFVEGAITFAVLGSLRRVRPELLGAPAADAGLATGGAVSLGAAADAGPAGKARPGLAAVSATVLTTALLLAGVVSWFASSHPDGLEWAIQEHKYSGAEKPLAEPAPAVTAVEEAQSKVTPMKDYLKGEGGWPNVSGWASLAGVAGTVVTLALLYGVTLLLRRRKGRPAQPV